MLKKRKSNMVQFKEIDGMASYSVTKLYRVWFNDTITQYSLVKTTGRWTILGPECRIELRNKPDVRRKIKEIVVKEAQEKDEAIKKTEQKLKTAKRLKKKNKGVKRK